MSRHLVSQYAAWFQDYFQSWALIWSWGHWDWRRHLGRHQVSKSLAWAHYLPHTMFPWHLGCRWRYLYCSCPKRLGRRQYLCIYLACCTKPRHLSSKAQHFTASRFYQYKIRFLRCLIYQQTKGRVLQGTLNYQSSSYFLRHKHRSHKNFCRPLACFRNSRL